MSTNKPAEATQDSDQEALAAIIQVYFECMFESSAEKTHQAFHPNARITGVMGGNWQEMTVAEFAALVAKQQPSPKDQGLTPRLDILSIEVAGNTAVARVRDDYLGLTFLDTLAFVAIDGEWSIYNKLFFVEGQAS